MAGNSKIALDVQMQDGAHSPFDCHHEKCTPLRERCFISFILKYKKRRKSTTTGKKEATTQVQRIWSSHEKGGNKKEWHNSTQGVTANSGRGRRKDEPADDEIDKRSIASHIYFPPKSYYLADRGVYTSQFLRAILRPAQPQTLYTSNMRDIWNIASRDLANRLRRYTRYLESVAEENLLPESKKRSIYYFDERHYYQQSTATWG